MTHLQWAGSRLRNIINRLWEIAVQHKIFMEVLRSQTMEMLNRGINSKRHKIQKVIMSPASKNNLAWNNFKEFYWLEFPEERRKAQIKKGQYFKKLCLALQITRAHRNLAIAFLDMLKWTQKPNTCLILETFFSFPIALKSPLGRYTENKLHQLRIILVSSEAWIKALSKHRINVSVNFKINLIETCMHTTLARSAPTTK